MALKDVFSYSIDRPVRCSTGAGRRPRSRWRSTCRHCPCRGGVELLRRLFEPTRLAASRHEPARTRSRRFPTVGAIRATSIVRLTGEHLRLSDALNHLYVLLPVLDDGKHYWVSNDEVDKLIRAGQRMAGHASRQGAHQPRRYLGPSTRADPVGDRPAGRDRRHRSSNSSTTPSTARSTSMPRIAPSRSPNSGAARCSRPCAPVRRPNGWAIFGCGEGAARARP